MIVGAHVSASGGLVNAIYKAESLGCDVFQMFPSSPQTFKTPDHSPESITAFINEYKNHNFQSFFFHAIYLINLASENQRLVDLSKESLISYLQIGSTLGAVGTIVHLGSYGWRAGKGEGRLLKMEDRTFGRSQIQILDRVVGHITDILQVTPEDQLLIAENAAGSSKIGGTLEDLVYLFQKVNSDRLRFCIDTQHLFASGINSANGREFNIYLDLFDRQIGIKNIICVHANDSKSALGSAHDRHENIGDGQIGIEGFHEILSQPALQDKPFILETPGFDDKGPDKKNLEILRSLI